MPGLAVESEPHPIRGGDVPPGNGLRRAAVVTTVTGVIPASLRSRASTAVDVALAVGLVLLGQLEVWSGSGDRRAAGLALLATAPVLARRLAPVSVLMVCAGALTVLTLRGEDEFTVAQLLALMLAIYTVGTARQAREAVVWLAVVLAAALANSAAAPSPESGDFIFPLILLGVPWAAGASLRQWRLRAEELRRLTDELRAEREAHARLVVTAERGRIARDLHDSLAQALNAVVVHAEAAEAALGRDEDRVAGSLARIQEVGRTSLADIRQILVALRGDDDAAGQPRLDQLEPLIDRFRKVGLDVTTDVRLSGSTLPAAVEAAAYRIVQEGLTNVMKHSGGGRAWVTIRGSSEVDVEVRDDGPGAATGTGPPGFGILGMQERAQLLGGRLTTDRDARGWVLRVRIPLQGPS